MSKKDKLTEDLVSNLWRVTPSRMAEHLTRGQFKRWNYIEHISREITAAIGKGNARVIVTMPPRHGKSTLLSMWVPVWYLSHSPEHNIILTSYEADFAASWGRRVRNLILEHGNELEVDLMDDSHAANRWNTIDGGGMVTAGIGGPITGRGGNLLLIDDYLKNAADASSETIRAKQMEWLRSTFLTRAEPGASIIILATRWHENDLIGELLSSKYEFNEPWTYIRLPALAEENDLLGRTIGEPLCPERYDKVKFEQIKEQVGTRVWNALYQARPSPNEGSIIKRAWFKFYSNVLPEQFDEMIQSWDLSFKDTKTSDFCVGQIWGRKGRDKYLIDQVRERLDFVGTIQAIRNLSRRYVEAKTILIEERANGAAIISSLKSELSGIVPINPKDSKVARVNAITPQLEAGNVHIPDLKANWVQEFIEECAAFPFSAHDDAVDAMSQALTRLDARAKLYSLDFSGVASMTRVSPFRRRGF